MRTSAANVVVCDVDGCPLPSAFCLPVRVRGDVFLAKFNAISAWVTPPGWFVTDLGRDVCTIMDQVHIDARKPVAVPIGAGGADATG